MKRKGEEMKKLQKLIEEMEKFEKFFESAKRV